LVSEEAWLARMGADGVILEVNGREQMGLYHVPF
jgi:hypothetical protein